MASKVSDLQTPEQKRKAKRNISAPRNEICDRRRFVKAFIVFLFFIHSKKMKTSSSKLMTLDGYFYYFGHRKK